LEQVIPSQSGLVEMHFRQVERRVMVRTAPIQYSTRLPQTAAVAVDFGMALDTMASMVVQAVAVQWEHLQEIQHRAVLPLKEHRAARQVAATQAVAVLDRLVIS
jgi:hypothetical protein